jgi:PAP2 superfamily
MSAYVLILASYSKIVGLPSDTIQVFAWMWAGTVAWNIQAPPRSHLVFVRDWWPALAVLEIYLYSRGLTDNIGLSVHITAPIDVDAWLGGGELPTQHLQQALCGDPCQRSNPPHWYDGALTLVYYTHFIGAPLVALTLYLRNRVVWLSFMRRYVTLYMAGLLVYITYPMAPPWMASRDGYVDGATVVRITGRGWDELNIEHFHQWLSRTGNQVAAMPSLHAGTAALIAFYGIARLRSRWRGLLMLYPIAMSFMLVYYGEHYVVDIIAGWALALVVLIACTDWERGGVTRRAVVALSSALLATPRKVAIPHQRGETDVEESATTVSDVWLTRMRGWPPLVVPGVLLVLLIIGVMATAAVALTALALLAGFVVWVGRGSWPRLAVAAALIVLATLATIALL